MTAAETYAQEMKKREPNNVLRLQSWHPHQSTCRKCGLPWAECSPKDVSFSTKSSAFAMCTFCWDNSDLNERIVHYKSLWYEWQRWPHPSPCTLEQMEAAVILESNICYE